MLLSIDGTDRRTDRFIDPAPHSMKAASIKWEIVQEAYDRQLCR